jgi:hypothetical protein
LAPSKYTDEEVSLKTVTVYQHIYSNYGAGNSVYQSHGLAVNYYISPQKNKKNRKTYQIVGFHLNI